MKENFLTDTAAKFTEDLIRRFEIELKFAYVSEIIQEERILKEFKGLYIKHAFDGLGSRFKDLYDNQCKFVQELKAQYKQKYVY